MIIWHNGLLFEDKLLSEINNSSLKIIRSKKVKWAKENFRKNLQRLYGNKLPKNSSKEDYCGFGPFLVIELLDEIPHYDLRKTSSGHFFVNKNIFDLKTKLRTITGGGHLIHGTDNLIESNQQLTLFFNNKKYSNVHDFPVYNSWDSLLDFFNFINDLNLKYVYLRNYDNLENVINSIHPDVDLLIEDIETFVRLTGVVKDNNDKHRVKYYIHVQGKRIDFDLRNYGDNYYDLKWQHNMIKTRVFKNGFYVLNLENQFYSLLYHALIHKRFISKDYCIKLNNLAKQLNSNLNNIILEDLHIKTLNNFLVENGYKILSPRDLSVYFNFNIKFFRYEKIPFKRKVKIQYLKTLSFASKLKNKIIKNS